MTRPATANASAHAEAMNRMYRYTRHIYDVTRRYYLLGRDRLLAQMIIRPGDRVLEMGCGTARNLIRLNRLRPAAALYGLDASLAMLNTAQEAIRRTGATDAIVLRHCLAEQLDHQRTFDLPEPFNVIFFSYSLSMMPAWAAAIQAAMKNLHPDGRICIVDFWDQGGMPRAFAWLLQRWLALFHVLHRPELLEHLKQLEAEGRCRLTIQPLFGRYAYIAELEHAKQARAL